MKTSSDVRIATPSPDSTPRESVATKAVSITIVSVRTPVRFVIYPWIATVTQGQTDSIEGVSTGNAHSPEKSCLETRHRCAHDLMSTTCIDTRPPCEIRRLPLDCHCDSGVNSQH
jgi:hypothetical protein